MPTSRAFDKRAGFRRGVFAENPSPHGGSSLEAQFASFATTIQQRIDSDSGGGQVLSGSLSAQVERAVSQAMRRGNITSAGGGPGTAYGGRSGNRATGLGAVRRHGGQPRRGAARHGRRTSSDHGGPAPAGRAATPAGRPRQRGGDRPERPAGRPRCSAAAVRTIRSRRHRGVQGHHPGRGGRAHGGVRARRPAQASPGQGPARRPARLGLPC